MTVTPKKAPSAWWFGVAAAIFVLGLVPLAVVITNAVGGLIEYDVHGFDNPNSTELRVDGDQVAIYTTYNGAGAVRCNGGGPGAPVPDDPDAAAEATILPLEHPTWNVSISTGSTTWHRVAVTPDDWHDGTYLVACNVVSPGGSNPQPTLGYADNPSLLGTFLGFAIAIGIAGLATIAALALAIFVGVRRSRATRQPLPRRPEFPPGPPPMR